MCGITAYCGRELADPIVFKALTRDDLGTIVDYELKKLMLAYAFKYFNVVWFHIAPSNIRSQKATQKIGGVFSHERNSNHSGKPIPCMFYKIEKEIWLQYNATK